MTNVWTITACIAAYFLGNISPAILVSRALGGRDGDIRKQGSGNPYLTSKYGPDMRSLVIFTAPKGGKITNFKCNAKALFNKTTYQDLQVYYNPECFWIKAGKTVTWTFNVTTAPGVNVKPKIVKTPLLSAYRKAKAPK